MRVLVCLDFYLPGFRAGGPIQSVSRIVMEESEANEIFIVTRDHDLGVSQTYEEARRSTWVEVGHAQVLYINPASLREVSAAIKMIGKLRPDVIYFNSLFSPLFTVLPLAAVLASRVSSTILLAPRGELDLGAMETSMGKKKAAAQAIRPLVRSRSVVWHASSTLEVDNIRSWLGRHPRVIVSTDPSRPPDLRPSERRDGDALQICWVSRIVPKKNLVGALEICSELAVPAELRIVGPVEDKAYWGECRQLIENLPSHVRVICDGPLGTEQVLDVFRESDVFLFPTKGENFGHVVAEALSVGCPVVVGEATIWGGVLREGGGLVSDNRRATVEFLGNLAALEPGQKDEGREQALSAYRNWFSQTISKPSLFVEASRVRGERN